MCRIMFKGIRIFPLWAVTVYLICLQLKDIAATSQYHIQTDEGPERFFRFQTDNGQFRKEKRLQDGTVIGTEAWIDAAGYLRLKDYIADKHGYRILKSKTVYVGRGTNIQDAIKYTKSTPAQSGTLVNSNSGLFGDRNNIVSYKKTTYGKTPSFVTTTIATPTAGTPKLGYLTPLEAAKLDPIPYLGFDHYPNELPTYGKGYVRSKVNYYKGDSVTPKAIATLVVPPLYLEPPVANIHRRIQPIGIASTTPSPITNNNDEIGINGNRGGGSIYSTPAPFSNSLLTTINDNYLNNNKGYNYGSPYNGQNFQPIYDRHRFANYNGIASINHGFRYILPHQYHEEAEITETKKAGSYGYIDPFGIRRVVYYNASPEKGFVHRNNNQYVGFEATPYDEPKPIDI